MDKSGYLLVLRHTETRRFAAVFRTAAKQDAETLLTLLTEELGDVPRAPWRYDLLAEQGLSDADIVRARAELADLKAMPRADEATIVGFSDLVARDNSPDVHAAHAGYSACERWWSELAKLGSRAAHDDSPKVISRDLEAAAEHLDKLAAWVPALFQRREGEWLWHQRREDWWRESKSANDLTHSTWAAVVAVDAAIRSLGITDSAGHPQPPGMVGAWQDWRDPVYPVAQRELAERVLALGIEIHRWHSRLCRMGVEGEQGITEYRIPADTEAWARGCARRAQLLGGGGADTAPLVVAPGSGRRSRGQIMMDQLQEALGIPPTPPPAETARPAARTSDTGSEKAQPAVRPRGPAQRKPRRGERAHKVRTLLSGEMPYQGTKTDLALEAGYTQQASLASVKNFDYLWSQNEKKLTAQRAEAARRMHRPDA